MHWFAGSGGAREGAGRPPYPAVHQHQHVRHRCVLVFLPLDVAGLFVAEERGLEFLRCFP
jgi:hypothetical protein